MNVAVNQIYKHFKGDYYLVVGIAIDSESGNKMVVYKALYDDCKLFVRPLDMFISDVDKNKYPDCKQVKRFELQKINSIKYGGKNEN